jgi:hypothetical protein
VTASALASLRVWAAPTPPITIFLRPPFARRTLKQPLPLPDPPAGELTPHIVYKPIRALCRQLFMINTARTMPPPSSTQPFDEACVAQARAHLGNAHLWLWLLVV